jgi:hypothetical protein
MKKLLAVIFAASLILSGLPAWANSCPTLIREGRDLLGSTKLSSGDQTKVKSLLDDAQKLHDAGSHDESMKKANQALGMLKK